MRYNHKLSGGVVDHHQLANRPSKKMTHRHAMNEETLKLRFSKFWIFRDRTVHASVCRSRQCQHPDCSKLKGFFRHGTQCQVRASGGCVVCQKMWYFIHVHAQVCKESVCPVPRCRELKAHHRSFLQLKDSRRRAAVIKRMRKRVAELSQLWMFPDRTVHASRCRSRQCQHPDCSKLKGFFRHGTQCQVRASGGCVVCQKMWYLIHIHAQVCKESVCPVPRCRELKAHHKKKLQLKDSCRRAAVIKRMRKRAAELSLAEKQT